MVHGFYFRFLKYVKDERLGMILAKLAYSLVFLIYIAERIFSKKEIITLSEEEALKKIEDAFPDHYIEPEIINNPVDENLDLSFIIPTYNRRDFLDECLGSVINQKTKYNYEIMLVDDGSIDGSGEYAQKYKKYPNVKIIRQQNKGIAGARNAGLNAASGRYVMFMDDDDTVEPSIIETLLDKAYNEDLDIAMCAHNLVKIKDGEITNVIPNICPSFNLMSYKGNAKMLNYPGLPWGKVYKRELWGGARFFTGYRYEDTLIHTLIYPEAQKFGYVPKVLYQYKWHETNVSHALKSDGNVKNIDTYYLLKHILEKYEELNLPKDEKFETVLLKHLSSHYYGKIKGLNKELFESLFVLARGLYEKYGLKENGSPPYMLKVVRKALIQRDINLWKIASKFQK